MVFINCFIHDKKIRILLDKIWHIGSFVIFSILLIIFIATPIIIHANDAYYKHDNEVYYKYGDDWYYYDYYNWTPYLGSTDDFEYIDKSYNSNYGVSDFETSDYYEQEDRGWFSNDSSNNDWDSGSSWDSSDSWDSGGTDWSSDW